MKRRLLRALALGGVLFLFEGRLGVAVCALAAAAYELAGLPLWVLWACAVAGAAAAPFAIMVQGLPSAPVVGAEFGAAHVFARMLIQCALAFALYAIVAELSDGRQPNRSVRGTARTWGRWLAAAPPRLRSRLLSGGRRAKALSAAARRCVDLPRPGRRSRPASAPPPPG